MKTRFIPVLLLVTVAVPAPTVLAASSSRTRQVADLKSFFHGEPAPPPKAPPPPVTATVATAAGVTPDTKIEAFFRAYAAAVKAREGVGMLPLLAAKYTIADLPEGHTAGEFFAQAVDRTPGPEAIVIQGIEVKGTLHIAKVELRYPAKVSTKTFKFDADGKLLASDLFTLKRVEHGM